MNRSTVPPPVTQVMDEAEAWLPRLMGSVESRLGELVEGYGEELGSDARATLKAGGKRLRPMLVLLCAGPDAGAAAMRGAAAIELVHMATLVHDDVLDQAPLRRGLPTVVATSGRERATAVGDLLLSRAFAELVEGGEPGGGRQVELLAGASVGLALGELAQRRDAWDTTTSAERYLERCRLKTARLFECACLIGRVSAGDDPAADALRTFGCEIGLAFQLLDDVLDVAGPAERTGKARGTDLLDGTVTLPLIIAPRARPRARGPRPARRSTSAPPRRRATGSPRPARSKRSEPTRATAWPRQSESSRHAKRSRKPSAASWRWWPTASSNATPSGGTRYQAWCQAPLTVVPKGERLEVFGEDRSASRASRKRSHVRFHVRPRQLLEVVEDLLAGDVESVVEAVGDLLGENAVAAPFALGTAKTDAPPARTGRLPVHGINEVAVTTRAERQVTRGGRGRRAGRPWPGDRDPSFCSGERRALARPVAGVCPSDILARLIGYSPVGL